MTCMRVVFTGTGAAVHPRRGQASLLLDTGAERVAIDFGCHAPNIVEARGVRLETIDAFIVTHIHYDHICGIPHALFVGAYRRTGWSPLVAVPAATLDEAAVLFASVPGALKPRVAPHTRAARIGDLRLEYAPAVHTVEAAQIQIEYKGLRLVVSGDTTPTGWFRERARGAALAVHEATAPSWAREKALATGHSTVTEALLQVEEAQLGALYHLSVDSEQEALTASGRIMVPEDGTVLTLC